MPSIVSPRPTSFLVFPVPFVITQGLNGPLWPPGTASVHCRLVATGGPKPVVLVVDDEPAIRLLCRVNLELGGYEVREAGTLAEARERVRAGGIDAVLLDMHLGTERSNEFLAELTRAGMAVAVVTGSTDLESVARAGADAVLRKPFTIEELESTVAQLTAPHASRL